MDFHSQGRQAWISGGYAEDIATLRPEEKASELQLQLQGTKLGGFGDVKSQAPVEGSARSDGAGALQSYVTASGSAHR
eukprot:484322-Amphidinium_carterae.1